MKLQRENVFAARIMSRGPEIVISNPLRLFRFLCLCICSSLLGAASLELPRLLVGSNLQTPASIKLSEPAPEGGLEITVASESAGKVRFANRPDEGGAESLILKVPAGLRETLEFWVQGMASGEEVSYSATAPDFGSGNGTVVLSPSAIILAGPFRGPRFPTTTGAAPSRLVVSAVRLDSSMDIAERQLVAGGLKVEVELSSSNEAVGTVLKSTLTIAGGSPGEATEFKPAAAGSTTLALSVPPGFTRLPEQVASVIADVALPGLGLPQEVMVGQNLQIAAHVGLGEAAPKGGVTVTVTSDRPDLLLLSQSAVAVGTRSLVLSIPEDGVSAEFFLQALGKAGRVEFKATAAGHRDRTGSVILAPSGVVIAPKPYGPPDEAELFRKGNEEGDRGFVSHLTKAAKMPLAVWMAHLDPVTLRSADVTVQPLRGGISLKVDITVSDAKVGGVVSPVTIEGGSEHGSSEFTPLGKGTAVITAITPEGFTKSTNSTSVGAIVRE